MRVFDKRDIRRNCIVWVDLGTHRGHIQSGLRPCIVVSCDKANRHAPVYTVIPGTTQKEKAAFPVHFVLKSDEFEGFLKKQTIFLAEQICTIDANQIFSYAGQVVSDDAINELNRILIRQLGLEGESRG